MEIDVLNTKVFHINVANMIALVSELKETVALHVVDKVIVHIMITTIQMRLEMYLILDRYKLAKCTDLKAKLMMVDICCLIHTMMLRLIFQDLGAHVKDLFSMFVKGYLQADLLTCLTFLHHYSSRFLSRVLASLTTT